MFFDRVKLEFFLKMLLSKYICRKFLINMVKKVFGKENLVVKKEALFFPLMKKENFRFSIWTLATKTRIPVIVIS